MSFELEIESLAFGGAGVGHHQGKAVFVPLTAPGDLARVRPVHERKKYTEAEMTELLRPAPVRRPPPCPVFGTCGGCQWQHLPYPEQCRWKERQVREVLLRLAKVPEPPVLPLVPSPDEWHYRSRVQFKCRQTSGGFVMGFYRRGSHFVIDVEQCPITAAPLNQALLLFRRWLPASPCPAEIPQVDLDCGEDGKVRAVIHVIGGQAAELAAYLRPLGEAASLSVFLQAGRKETLLRVCGEADLQVLAGEPPLALAYGPGGFAQVNLAQNQAMVNAVLDTAALGGSERVLDLYCGMGNLSLPLAREAAQVVGVEAYAPAIEKARENALRNGCDNVIFHPVPAEGAAGRLAGDGSWDLVVLDPPRTGAYGVMKDLLALRPPRILYVSCDPATLARDLVPLLHGGYDLSMIRPFDFFPQTAHVENVALVVLRGNR